MAANWGTGIRNWLDRHARMLVLLVVTVLPTTLSAQMGPLQDRPRSLALFSGIASIYPMDPARFGTAANPKPNELGFLIVLRLFRDVCLRLERGVELDIVMPREFSSHAFSAYYFGADAAPRGPNLVLSATGDIDADESNGHPVIWLEPSSQGMICKVEWHMSQDPGQDVVEAISGLILHWVPWELSLIPGEKPSAMNQSAAEGLGSWDRPCQDRWCPVSVLYAPRQTLVSLSTRLNITDIGGVAP